MKTTIEMMRMHLLALNNGKVFPVAHGFNGAATRVFSQVANDNTPPTKPLKAQGNSIGGCNDRD